MEKRQHSITLSAEKASGCPSPKTVSRLLAPVALKEWSSLWPLAVQQVHYKIFLIFQTHPPIPAGTPSVEEHTCVLALPADSLSLPLPLFTHPSRKSFNKFYGYLWLKASIKAVLACMFHLLKSCLRVSVVIEYVVVVIYFYGNNSCLQREWTLSRLASKLIISLEII